MQSHQFRNLRPRSFWFLWTMFAALSAGSLVCFHLTIVNGRQQPRNDVCTGSFAGRWQSPNADTFLNIGSAAGAASATISNSSGVFRNLKGVISGNVYQGNWSQWDPDGGRSGTFSATLNSAQGRIDISFRINQSVYETGVWFCHAQQPFPPPTPEPTAQPTATPTPEPGANLIRDDQDQDNFRTFDSLPPEQQVIVLTRRGPRMKVQYTADNFEMRILVRRGMPILLEYALDSDVPAELTLDIPDHEQIIHLLQPVDRGHSNLVLPDDLRGLLVAKLRVRALNSDGYPANFQLRSLAIGARGQQALRRLNERLVAMNGLRNESMSLVTAMPQNGTSLQIQVELPATLKVKQKPENRISFSCTSAADFSDGRWEWWRVVGLDWTKVWQHQTGSLSRNQTKSEDWNGIITRRKLVSLGAHALQLTAWQQAGKDRDSVVARVLEQLTVIE